VGSVAGNDGRSVISLDHDRAGTAAAVLRLTATCDPGDAVKVYSQVPGVRRYERVEYPTGRFVARWYDRFPGGCVAYHLESAADTNGQFAAETTLMFDFRTHAALGQALEQRSAGRLHLDVPGS
jgi:hypothetical protein